jgi:hypothetical protein
MTDMTQQAEDLREDIALLRLITDAALDQDAGGDVLRGLITIVRERRDRLDAIGLLASAA